MQSHQLNADTTNDLFQTLFGKTTEELRDSTALWDTRMTLDLAFVSEENADDIYALVMSVPMGEFTVTKEKWDAFLTRLAVYVSQSVDKSMRPATHKEVYEASQREYTRELAQSLQGRKYDA